MLSVIMGASGWLRHQLTSMDMFSKNINLTYAGKGSFRTLLGGIFSFFTVAIMLGYALVLIGVMTSKTSTNVQVSKHYKNQYISYKHHHISQNGVEFVLGWAKPGDIDIDRTYGNISMKVVTSTDNTTYLGYEVQEIELESCDIQQRYNYTIPDSLSKISLYCPKSTDYYISGDGLSNGQNSVIIEFKK